MIVLPFRRSPVARRRLTAAVLTAGLLAVTGTTLATPAAAAGGARVTVSPQTADPEYATRLQLRGTGFQSVRNGFGGIYVFFGWVDQKWRPSQGGQSGVDYVYVQDSETKDNRGFQRFVSYPGDPTAYAANGGQLTDDGTWATTLIVPGPTFPARGRSGEVEQIDCRKVQCGIITIGGHGVVNANNETFTPITFDGTAPTATTAPAPLVSSQPATAPSARATAGVVAAASPPAAATPSRPVTSSPPVDVSAQPVASVRTSTSVSVPKVLIGVAVILVVASGVLLVLRRRRKPTEGAA
jgi:hypothetical protein